ncbi:beta-N-acetylhexosaminidase [Pseudobutyrivibrio sp. YE44]|uniref:glycoside hydrolase family 3 protein n=1 Tax=Pseudobutyrivibrio sp. YE44 TaxID=1520802 RepID=UPI0008847C95|nr:glycoside hydrolase family 3 N-terminal domain-containing protein [Pseudobutyrivibrio sp. YE44]SDB23732.1 beta-N-acetylhexosaminidase [Pseudobutyrivibrio sp. YE44]
MRKRFAFAVALLLTTVTVISPLGTVNAQAKGSIEQLVSEMPLEQKVAQMIMPSFRYWGTGDNKKGVTELNDLQKATLTKYNFGGVILFAQNTQEATQTTELVNEMQKANLQGGAKSSLLISIDQEGGYITRLQTGTQMPGNMAIGATGNPENAYRAANVIGKELAIQGINVDFAPVMDVNNNPGNPIIGVRSFSDNPNTVAKFGLKYIEGLHRNGVMTALKHFPGHGDTATDSHTGLPLINKTYDELKQMELIPYAAVAKKSDFVMTAHIQYPKIETGTYTSKLTGEQINLPATLSKTILTGILRKDLCFDGVIITDALDMDAIAKHFDKMDATKLAINAGANMLLIPLDLSTEEGLRNLDTYINNIVAAINAGEISIDAVNDSVTRILEMKAKYGLLVDDTLNTVSKWSRIQPSAMAAENIVGCKAHHDTEWDIALEAITSVKNDKAFPIASDKKVVILYPSDSQQKSFDFAMNKLKESGVKINKKNITTVYVEDYDKFNVAQNIAGADVVICLSAIYSAEIDNKAFVTNVISEAHKINAKAIVLSAHLPYDTALYPDADGIVACYNARGMTELPSYKPNTKQYGPNLPAAIYVLFGGAGAKGKLPVQVK